MQSRKAHRPSRSKLNRFLSVALSVAMITTSSNLEYVGKAYAADASSTASATQPATTADPSGDASD
ncbi:MAG: hypothetical protein WAY93_03425, partial [Atopobiaceae bacterium]